MKIEDPLVSVVMPVFNAEKTVVKAAESILSQAYKNFELLIIDDGSTDQSVSLVEKIKDKRIRLIKNGVNRGIVSVLNDALRIASGDLVARQDADDQSSIERLERQVRILTEEPDLVAVGSALHVIDEYGRSVGVWSYPQSSGLSRWQLLFKTPLAHSAAMYRKLPVCEIGGYSDAYRHAEDYHLWSRLSEIGGLRSVEEPLLKYSIASSGVSRRNAEAQREVHCKIAQENIRKKTGLQFPMHVIKNLCFLADDENVSASSTAVRELVDALSRVFDKFKEDVEFDKLKESIASDCATRITSCIRRLRFGERLKLLSDVRAGGAEIRLDAMDTIRCLV